MPWRGRIPILLLHQTQDDEAYVLLSLNDFAQIYEKSRLLVGRLESKCRVESMLCKKCGMPRSAAACPVCDFEVRPAWPGF